MSTRNSWGGARPIARALSKVTSQAFGRRGFVEAEVLTRWRDIVGPHIAGHSMPEKLVRRHGGAGGATLMIRVDAASALDLQHNEPQIVERINAYYGYRAIARLHLHQGPLPAPIRVRENAAPNAPAELSASIAAATANVGDPALKRALADLGRRVWANSAPKTAAPEDGKDGEAGEPAEPDVPRAPINA